MFLAKIKKKKQRKVKALTFLCFQAVALAFI